MICDSIQKYAISNLGWIDKGDLWIYDNSLNKIRKQNLSDSKYLSLHEGINDYFSICHYYDGGKFEISIHHFDLPEKILCKYSFNSHFIGSDGDCNLAKYVPRFYIVGLNINNDFKFHLINIQDDILVLDDSNVNWYYNGNFDYGYQGLIGVTEFKDELLFCVQRDGSIYRINKETNQLISKVNLANRYGNPRITFNKDKTKIFVDDYDTLLRINPSNWEIERVKLLQTAEKGAAQFIGFYSLNKHNDFITLARPFSSDVIILDKDFNIINSCKIGKQPLESVIFNNDTKIVARDWQTGVLLMGQIDNKPSIKRWFNKWF